MQHHADPSGVYQSRRVIMLLECSPGELLTRSAFMHHDDQWHDALIRYAGLKGLSSLWLIIVKYHDQTQGGRTSVNVRLHCQ